MHRHGGLGLGIQEPGLGSSLSHLLPRGSVPQFPHLNIGSSDEVMATKGFGQPGRVAHTPGIMVWE